MVSADEKEIEVSITGKVQGVNFRRFVKDHAEEFELTGYVCNLSDGSVEVVAQGQEDQLKKLVKLLERGPYFARVDEIEVAWHDTLQDVFTDFQIKEAL